LRRRFFVERFTDGTARLGGAGAHHLGRVLRAEPGQLYELSDGQTVHLAEVQRVERDWVDFKVIAPVVVRAPGVRVALLLAVVKFDRFEWALEKAVELGAEFIAPIAAERSEKSLVAAAPKRAERWRKIILESAQQARCVRLPVLGPLARPREAFVTAAKAGLGVLLSERGEARPLRLIFSEAAEKNALKPTGPEAGIEVSLAVGPEGGWTDAEFASAAAAGFREASLGGNILRTETAVAAGLSAAHLYFDD
jgi:16S rRNA (uracil1498-N3)-methyltransferase